MNPVRVRGAVIGAIVLVVVVGAIALAAVTRSGSSTAAPDDGTGARAFGAVGASETVACPGYPTAGAAITESGKEVEGKTFSCGVVVVPENHDKPDGRTIELFYLKLHSTAQKPARAEAPKVRAMRPDVLEDLGGRMRLTDAQRTRLAALL